MLFFEKHQMLIFALVKILIMLGFFVNMAPLLVFAERRQSALIQDRVGPNRAVIAAPGVILKGAFATPALLAALLVAFVSYVVFPANGPIGPIRGFWFAQLGVFLAWAHLQILAGWARNDTGAHNPLEGAMRAMREPRAIFFGGLAAHLVLWLAWVLPSDAAAPALANAFAYGGPALLALVLLGTGAYVGYRIPSGRVELRVAGLFHSIADALKAAFKEDFVPPQADKLLHALGPLIAIFPALVTFAVIPFGEELCFGGNDSQGGVALATWMPNVPRAAVPCPAHVSLQIADLNVGLLFVFAVAGTGIVGAAIAGWSSDNKWSLLGGLRAASQMVSYEVTMGLSLVGALMVYASPRLGDMARWQSDNTWGIFVQPLAFFIFFASAIAEQKRVPFDAPEGESEIIAGYFVEYSSFKWLMFYTGEYIEMVTSSALLVAVFLGGWAVPFLHQDGFTVSFGDAVVWQAPLSQLTVVLLQIAAFFFKVTVLAFGQIFIRWTLPRFRYDQIMAFGWKFLLPASIGNLVVTGALILLVGQGGPSVQAGLKVLADLTQLAVVLAVLYVLVRFVLLLLSPIDRAKFTRSTSAARVARFGGVKTGPMQA